MRLALHVLSSKFSSNYIVADTPQKLSFDTRESLHDPDFLTSYTVTLTDTDIFLNCGHPC